jgi:hypothetical protein
MSTPETCYTPMHTVCKVGLAVNRTVCLNLTVTPLIKLFLIETRNVISCDLYTLLLVNIERNIIGKQINICEQNSSILKFGLTFTYTVIRL